MTPEVADPLSLLPHRPPFRFVTQVTELVPGAHAIGLWLITGREDFFAGHFPGNPIVPGVLLAEALAQLSGIVAFSSSLDNSSARLAHTDIKFTAAIIPPAEITLHSRLLRTLGDLTQFEVSASHSGIASARGTLALAGGRQS